MLISLAYSNPSLARLLSSSAILCHDNKKGRSWCGGDLCNIDIVLSLDNLMNESASTIGLHQVNTGVP